MKFAPLLVACVVGLVLLDSGRVVGKSAPPDKPEDASSAAAVGSSSDSQMVGPTMPRPSSPRLTDAISAKLREAVNEGGLEFKAHAKAYREAVEKLDGLLRDRESGPAEIADACDQLAVTLEQTEAVLTRIDLDKFDRVSNEVFALLNEQLHQDQVQVEAYKAELAKLEKEMAGKSRKDLDPVQRSRIIRAETGSKTATFRLEHFATVRDRVTEVRDYVHKRNSSLEDISEVHRNLADVYRNLATTARVVRDLQGINAVLVYLAEESTYLQEKVARAGDHMRRVLDRLAPEAKSMDPEIP